MVWLSEPTEEQIEAAAKAWMSWQFPGRSWDDAVPALKDKFKDGAKKALLAAADIMSPGSARGCA
jgi:hypothetical protein